ncbi:hypothetical protein [Anaeropeptidivorans aminofermentans]|uniref:hypothetical protein n=1 Tax=Anaeropeptidivorans aminofermentans TaxID=2934315 RepID=UPI002025A7D7|nr:hypothetical protein [Anaeropeptidivorans aminofermentans]
MQLTSGTVTTVDDGDNVLFDTVINDQAPDITYNPATGEFTITQAGNYDVLWWISTDGAQASTYVSFEIVLDGIAIVSGASPIVTGQLMGSAFITVAAVPAVLTLSNNTGATVNYGLTPVLANLVIRQIMP